MNQKQRCVLIVGFSLIFFLGLFPPVENVLLRPEFGDFHKPDGRTFLFLPRETRTGIREYHIDHHRLAIEWVTISAITGAV